MMGWRGTRLDAVLGRQGGRSSWGQRFAHGVFWSTVATAVSYAASLVVLAITGRLLGARGFGQYGIVTSTVAMFGILAGMGLGLAATKYIAELRHLSPLRAGRVLGQVLLTAMSASAIVMVVLFVLAPWLATHSLSAPELAPTLRYGCLLLAANAINGVQAGALAGFEAFRTVARVNVIRGLVGVPLGIAGVMLGGVPGAVVGAAATVAFGCWLNHRALQRVCAEQGIVVSYRIERGELDILWRFSLPAVLASAFVLPAQWLASAILARSPGGYVELGFVNAASNWRSLITFLPVTIAGAALPAFAAVAADDSHSRAEGLELAYALNQLVLWPTAVVTMLLAGPMLGAYGPEFGAGRLAFVLLLGGTAIGFVGNTLGTLITSQGRMWFGALQNLTFGAVLVGVTTFSAAAWGAVAIAAGTAAGYFLLLCWTAVYLCRRGDIPGSLAWRTVGGGVLMALCTTGAALIPPGAALWVALPAAVGAVVVALALVEGGVRLRLLGFVRRLHLPRVSMEVI